MGSLHFLAADEHQPYLCQLEYILLAVNYLQLASLMSKGTIMHSAIRQITAL